MGDNDGVVLTRFYRWVGNDKVTMLGWYKRGFTNGLVMTE